MEELVHFLKENSFTILLALTALILLKYLHGRKKNLTLAKSISARLEKILDPDEKLYTWIGGVSGFKAMYKRGSGLEVKATLVMKPRHSLIYLPISLLIFGGDKLFLVFKSGSLTPSEGHIIESGYKRIPKAWLPSPSDFDHIESVDRGGKTYALFAKDEATMKHLHMLVDRLTFNGILHIAVIPENETAYFAVDPADEGLDVFFKNTLDVVENARPPQ